MKSNASIHAKTLLAASAIILVSGTGETQAAIAAHFIGVDGQATQPSGAYMGLANPNHQRLTFLYAHYDENDPLYPHHCHSKGRYINTVPNLGVNTAVTVSTSNFLPEAPQTHLMMGSHSSGAYAGKMSLTEDPHNHFTLLRIFATGKLDPNVALENTLFNSSAQRWT